MSAIEGKNSDEVLVVGVTFMKKGDLPVDQLEDIMEKEQVNPSQIRHQKRTSIDDITTSFNPINLDHIFEDVDLLSDWIQEKENALLNGEITGVLHVDTSDDEMNVDESQQQNMSPSSSSATPSQSGDRLDSGGLSPIDDDNDDDDSGGGGRDEIRSSKARIDRSEPKVPSTRKGKKHTSEGSSSGRRSRSSNLGQRDSSTSTQGPSHGKGHKNQVNKVLKIKVNDMKLLVI
ncbi:hypothetical protein F3Y22_tig00111276pilonHSYRG00009 [Hibiscus syriacus]|uniref:Uncharacterized protein n=1 Tax=Hibiscus syriacus TaxID=106335 RepID=A0A6A2YRQ1_HIBSY|nr:hypothetical protein F3Y22_tig00111276pilonHSYRG00009 [Hibiscus syriacus]